MNTTIQGLFSLQGQMALITGGTRGIGQAMAIALASAGADICLLVRSQSNTDTRDKITALGRQCHLYTGDLSDTASMRDVVSLVVSQHPRIDILLNCGGVQSRAPAAEFSDEEWDRVLQVNLSAPFRLSRDIGRHMLKQELVGGRRGTIINVASLLSFQGGIYVPAYAASKGGVAQFTKSMSNEWASKGVMVNAIAPGYIATDMNEALMADTEGRAKQILERIPANRWGQPEDFAGPVVFLASRASSYVSGEILTVDGGWMGR